MTSTQETGAALDAARRATAEAQASVQAATSSDVVPTAGIAADVVKALMAQARAQIIAGRTQALEAQAAARTTGDLSEQLRAVHLEEARARYMEDFGDATGWEDHARGLSLVTDLDRNGKWAGALRHLVKRYLEEGRTPAGLTVAEAVAGLGEPLLAPGDRWHPAGTTVDEQVPEEIAALTFPADGCPQDAR